jgi:large subunit ribosomal protein L2
MEEFHRKLNMGKRIISQARGKGSLTYRVRKRAFQHKIGYPTAQEGEAEILKIFHSAGHTAPLMKLKVNEEVFFNPAFNAAFEGQKINLGKEGGQGSILPIEEISPGTKIYNVERNPGDGGKMIRTAGSSATVFKKYPHNKVSVAMSNKKEVKISGSCRATIGQIAGSGRKLKPLIKAGKKYYKMKARSKLWPRTSAVKMNAVDHPFGSGRGKRIKSKIAKRNAPSGRRVGHLRPTRTGKIK